MKHLKILFSSLLLVGFLSSCKKDNSYLDTEVLPAEDVLNATYSDTTSVFMHTVSHDSIISVNDRYKFLGSNQDPHFGRTDVSLYTNANLPNGITSVSFGEDPSLVSSELILTVASLDFVGSYTCPITYSLFALSQSLDKTKTYYTNEKTYHNTNALLGTFTGSYSVMNDRLVIKIPVNSTFAASILSNTSAVADNAVFQSLYKGFYITSSQTPLNPTSAQGCIAKFDLEDEVSGFYLYYQNGAQSPTKELKTFKFTFSGVDACRFNTVRYDKGSIANNQLYAQLVNKDTAVGKQAVFLKGLGGMRVKIQLPWLKNYSDSFPVAVNRAELVLNVDPSFSISTGNYVPPSKLALLAIQEDGKETYVLDQLNETDFFRYDGNYDATTNRYIFNISRQVQAILRGTKKNLGFYLVVADPYILNAARRDHTAQRAILAGTANTSLQPKFNLTYIKFDKEK